MHTCSTCQHQDPIQLFSGLTEDGKGLVAIQLEDEDTGEISSVVFTLEEARALVKEINETIATTQQRVNALALS
jgi:hypothetical protein